MKDGEKLPYAPSLPQEFIVEILERTQIRQAYNDLFHEDLIIHFESELSGDFEHLRGQKKSIDFDTWGFIRVKPSKTLHPFLGKSPHLDEEGP
ncbi:hypothetical protein RJT34_27380 [Clitoria ternatea]|uniref:Uncharacterized protein n=1 Tax=Clitoria ternatea TaxID=43366 RepID=A0AAN9FC70_CLITE